MTATHARTRIVIGIALAAAGVAARAADGRFGAVLTAFDELARPGEVVTVRAKLEHDGLAGLHPHLHDHLLAFGGPGVGAREARTAGEGIAAVEVRTPGGPGGGVERVRVRFDGSRHHRPAEATARVFAWPAGRPILVVDIDHTISDRRERDVLFVDNAAIPAVDGAVDALTKLARSYRIVYLTARDESLFNKSRAWLEARGFPEGPLFTRDYNLFGPGQGAFKRRFLVDLRRRFPDLAVGVGDTPDDARAYLDAGLKAVLLGPAGGGRYPPESIIVPSWQGVCDTLLPADAPADPDLDGATGPAGAPGGVTSLPDAP